MDKTRLCVDYRNLKKLVFRDRYSIPLIADHLEKLQKVQYFLSIDLRNGFFHVPMEEHSRKYTAFIRLGEQFEFLKTPFGFVTQAYFSDLLMPYLEKQ